MAQTLESMAVEAANAVGPNSATHISVCRDAIKRRYRDLAQAYSWPELAHEFTVTVTSGLGTVGLPAVIDSILSVWNVREDRGIVRMSQAELERQYGKDMATAGVLRAYTIQGVRGASKDLVIPALAPVSVASSNAADSCEVRLEGHSLVDGLPYSTSAVVNGIVPVFFTFASPASAAPLAVTMFSKNVSTVGSITMSQSGVSGSVSVIAPDELEAIYPWLRFNATASGDTSIRVQTTTFANDLTADNDTPVIRGSESVLVIGASADLYRFLQMHQKAIVVERQYLAMKDEFVSRAILRDAPITASGTMHLYGWGRDP